MGAFLMEGALFQIRRGFDSGVGRLSHFSGCCVRQRRELANVSSLRASRTLLAGGIVPPIGSFAQRCRQFEGGRPLIDSDDLEFLGYASPEVGGEAGVSVRDDLGGESKPS